MRQALRDRRLELGSARAVAAELGMPVGVIRRWMRDGPTPAWAPARVEAFANQLLTVAHESEQRRRANPELRALVERRRALAELDYPLVARQAIVAVIESALGELEERRACAYGSWTPRAEVAREIGVSSVRLGRWLARGRVPVSQMPAVNDWAQRRVERALMRQERQQKVEDLIQRAKRPALAHGLPGAPKAQAARAPDLQDAQGPYQSADSVGYKWDKRVEEFSSFALINQLTQWALGRRVPESARVGRAKLWIVTALVSIYDPPDSLAAKDERRQRRRRTRSPGAFRQFERKVDKQQLGRDIMLGAVVSSRTVRRGGLERAVRLWRENMVTETCENELVFVHALIIRNWRSRGERERERFIERERREWEARHAAEEARRERDKARVRERARKRALGRRGGNRAASERPSRRKKK